mgnify:CR=1 FL=1
MGAWASFWLVFLTSLACGRSVPARSTMRSFALRVSNGVLLTLLFATGYLMVALHARQAVARRSLFLAGGVGPVAVAIALGG